MVLCSMAGRGVEKWSRVMYRDNFYNKGMKYGLFNFFSLIFL